MATSIDAVSSDKLEALLQCSICLEALNNPRTLPCFHSYCKCCLERFVNNIRQNKPGADLQCPFCRSEFTLGQGGVEGMTSNHFIGNMLEVMAVQDREKVGTVHDAVRPSDVVRPARVIAGKFKRFTAYVYENDYVEIQKLVQQYPNIETGGDLFGLWQDDKSVVIQLFIGPGKGCKRTTTSFYQDVSYLEKVGAMITKEEGLRNVGEWHSHHQMGMPTPSEGDKQTVLSNMPQLGLDRFVLFIASIESSEKKKRSHSIQLKDITLRCFMYREGLRREEQPIEGKIVKIEENNPLHLEYKTRQVIIEGAE